MNKDTSTDTLVRTAPIIATTIALTLAIIKFTVGIFSGSVALLSSAIDSLLDTGVSIFNYFAIRFSQDPADNEHNYGHGKIEAIAATIEGIIITLSGIYIIYASFNKIVSPESISYINWTILVMFISILATGGLVIFLNGVYKKTQNLVIKGDALHYKMDLLTNIAVIATLGFIYVFPSLTWIDGIVGGIIGMYIIYEAYKLISQGINILLDTALEEDKLIKKIIQSYVFNGSIGGYHAYKTRQGGNHDKFVEFHFEMPAETTILQAHGIGDKIESDIKKLDKKSSWHIVWHVDVQI